MNGKAILIIGGVSLMFVFVLLMVYMFAVDDTAPVVASITPTVTPVVTPTSVVTPTVTPTPIVTPTPVVTPVPVSTTPGPTCAGGNYCSQEGIREQDRVLGSLVCGGAGPNAGNRNFVYKCITNGIGGATWYPTGASCETGTMYGKCT